jgi:hypothetical protein
MAIAIVVPDGYGGLGDFIFALKYAKNLREQLAADGKATDIIVISHPTGVEKVKRINGESSFQIPIMSPEEAAAYLNGREDKLDGIIAGPVHNLDLITDAKSNLPRSAARLPVLPVSEYCVRDYEGGFLTFGRACRVLGSDDSLHMSKSQLSGIVSDQELQRGLKPEKGILLSPEMAMGAEDAPSKKELFFSQLDPRIRSHLTEPDTTHAAYSDTHCFNIQYSHETSVEKGTKGGCKKFLSLYLALSQHEQTKNHDLLFVGKDKATKVEALKAKSADIFAQGFSKIEIIDPDSDTTEILQPEPPREGRTFRVILTERLAHASMKAGMALSDICAGVTGDQSLGEVISAGKIITYECLEHKQGLIGSLLALQTQLIKVINLREHIAKIPTEEKIQQLTNAGIPVPIDGQIDKAFEKLLKAQVLKAINIIYRFTESSDDAANLSAILANEQCCLLLNEIAKGTRQFLPELSASGVPFIKKACKKFTSPSPEAEILQKLLNNAPTEAIALINAAATPLHFGSIVWQDSILSYAIKHRLSSVVDAIAAKIDAAAAFSVHTFDDLSALHDIINLASLDELDLSKYENPSTIHQLLSAIESPEDLIALQTTMQKLLKSIDINALIQNHLITLLDSKEVSPEQHSKISNVLTTPDYETLATLDLSAIGIKSECLEYVTADFSPQALATTLDIFKTLDAPQSDLNARIDKLKIWLNSTHLNSPSVVNALNAIANCPSEQAFQTLDLQAIGLSHAIMSSSTISPSQLSYLKNAVSSIAINKIMENIETITAENWLEPAYSSLIDDILSATSLAELEHPESLALIGINTSLLSIIQPDASFTALKRQLHQKREAFAEQSWQTFISDISSHPPELPNAQYSTLLIFCRKLDQAQIPADIKLKLLALINSQIKAESTTNEYLSSISPNIETVLTTMKFETGIISPQETTKLVKQIQQSLSTHPKLMVEYEAQKAKIETQLGVHLPEIAPKIPNVEAVFAGTVPPSSDQMYLNKDTLLQLMEHKDGAIIYERTSAEKLSRMPCNVVKLSPEQAVTLQTCLTSLSSNKVTTYPITASETVLVQASQSVKIPLQQMLQDRAVLIATPQKKCALLTILFKQFHRIEDVDGGLGMLSADALLFDPQTKAFDFDILPCQAQISPQGLAGEQKLIRSGCDPFLFRNFLPMVELVGGDISLLKAKRLERALTEIDNPELNEAISLLTEKGASFNEIMANTELSEQFGETLMDELERVYLSTQYPLEEIEMDEEIRSLLDQFQQPDMTFEKLQQAAQDLNDELTHSQALRAGTP